MSIIVFAPYISGVKCVLFFSGFTLPFVGVCFFFSMLLLRLSEGWFDILFLFLFLLLYLRYFSLAFVCLFFPEALAAVENKHGSQRVSKSTAI